MNANIRASVIKSSTIPPERLRTFWIIMAAIWIHANFAIAQPVSPLVVQTISALRAIDTTSFTNHTLADVVAYYDYDVSLNDDRGGGFFRWETESIMADDGGRFIVGYPNTNGCWVRKLHGETANVKMWGAVGNGINNDTTNIQNAMNVCGAWGGGPNGWASELSFPCGTYLVTNTLVFNAYTVHLRGESLGGSIILMSSNANHDILQTLQASNVLSPGYSETSFLWDAYLLIENLRVEFQGDTTNHNRSNACIVVANPGEENLIRCVQTTYGGYGLRCLGGGQPGLHVQNFTVSDVGIAGISIEPLPALTYDDSDPVTLIGVSGDEHDNISSPTACLIRFTNSVTGGEIGSLKAEGDWGGGVIQHNYVPIDDPSSESGWGLGVVNLLDIHNCSYNYGGTYGGALYPSAFVQLGNTGDRTAVVTLRGNVINTGTLINDQMTGRVVNTDGNGSILSGRWPITYDAINNGSWGLYSKLVVGQSAIATFVPASNGWYQVMQMIPPYTRISGRLNWKTPFYDNTEMQMDLNASGSGLTDTWLNVTRATGLNYTPPIITQARAYETSGGMNVDLYVANPNTNVIITLAFDIGQYLEPGEPVDGPTQLLGLPLYLGSGGPPTGAIHVTTVNTYR